MWVGLQVPDRYNMPVERAMWSEAYTVYFSTKSKFAPYMTNRREA